MSETFPRDNFFLIAGPCVLEDDALNMRVAEAVAGLGQRLPGGVIFKASFDKANRSTKKGARGPGLDKGLAALERVKKATGLRVLTDVHLPDQCGPVAQVADVLQIPAFLCRQTDLLQAAAATGKPVNVKKGQWLQPEAMRGAVDKIRSVPGSSAEIAVTERGTFFGYGDLIVDMRSFSSLAGICDAPVIFDATHSVQKPGMGAGGSSGGAREFIPALSRAAVAAGASGLFLETHPSPESAPSDGPNMLPLNELGILVEKLLEVWHVTNRPSRQ